MALTFGAFRDALQNSNLAPLFAKGMRDDTKDELTEEEKANFATISDAIDALTSNETLVRGIDIIGVLELPDETVFDPTSEAIWTKAWNSIPESLRAPFSFENIEVSQSEIDELYPKGLSFGDFNDQMQGISLSLSGDMMLFGTGKSTRDFLVEVIDAMKANEAKIREITVEEVFESPPETLMDPSTIKIWVRAGKFMDMGSE